MDRPSAGAVASAQQADAFADKITAMSLIQALPDGPLDIVGDIHGEFDALHQLIRHLGYDVNGVHPEGRTLVFVGDFCDRGPDSPAVLALALRWIESGRAVAVLGNHEINLLREDAKDGSGWYFDERIARDNEKYAPYRRMDLAQRDATLALLSRLPIALERDDLRVIHAAWCEPQIGMARQLAPGSVRREYDHWEQEADRKALETRLGERMRAERVLWPHDLEDGSRKPPFLSAHAENESNKQMLNPLKVLTSGVERKGSDPFFAGASGASWSAWHGGTSTTTAFPSSWATTGAVCMRWTDPRSARAIRTCSRAFHPLRGMVGMATCSVSITPWEPAGRHD